MKMKRIMSALLAVLMMVSSFSLLIGAEGAPETEETESNRPKEYTYNTDNYTSLMAENPDFESTEIGVKNTDKYLYQSGEYEGPDGELVQITTPEEKLALMDYRYGNDEYGLYVDAYSGEVAVKCWATGETLFSNPYDLGTSSSTTSTKDTVREELLSQLIVNFRNLENSSDVTYLSYIEAVARNQVQVKVIKGGIRVEYAIGREATKTLVPRQIAKETFEKKILNVIREKLPGWDWDEQSSATQEEKDNFALYKKFFANYELKDPNDSYVGEAEKEKMLKEYPFTKTAPMYVILGDIKASQIAWLEQMIKLYCPDYTFSDLDADHLEVGYEAKAEVYPLFKMALEYTLDEDGLVVRLPANGIRFDESRYQLNYIQVLPYMGAGSDPNQGYTFFPDGSGTLFDFQSIESLSGEQEVSGKMYGHDYAYHQLSLLHKYTEEIRYPVFGLVETDATTKQERGYVAIVEEGDSLMQLTSYHGGGANDYHTVKMQVDPRPSDSYNLKDAISVGNNATVTVVSSRKYTGSYQVRYILLNDDQHKETLGEDFHECSYVGMAKAYRDYLEDNEVLSLLTEDDVEEDIPLYIETFGAIWSTKKVLSIPIDVTVPLTSFDNVATMYDELSSEGIENINFVLTGYTKGGLESEKIPYGLKWDKAVEDEMKFEELVAYAREKDFGLFPDFDFVFSSTNTLFDGLTLNKHAVKTIDNRFSSKREYSATKHEYMSFFELAISPAYFSRFYEKFMPKYLETNPVGISVSSLGSFLNSDFDEDEPYNRADSQAYTIQALQYIQEAMGDAEVLTSGGNAYSWKYVDHLKDVATDSSRYNLATASVPFLGIVLHGYVEFSGAPINMEGNLSYAFLKSLESGAALNFLLSYQNTETLKENEMTSKYFSIRYDIWMEDLIEMYNELNDLLSGVQTSRIDQHQFISTTVEVDNDKTVTNPDGSKTVYYKNYVIRVPDADELEADSLAAIQKAISENKAAAATVQRNLRTAVQKTTNAVANIKTTLAGVNDSTTVTNLTNYNTKLGELNTLLADPAVDTKLKELVSAWNALKDYAGAIQKKTVPAIATYDNIVDALDYLENEVEGFDEGTLKNLKDAMNNEAEIINVVADIRTQDAAIAATTAEKYAAVKAVYDAVFAATPEDKQSTLAKMYEYKAPTAEAGYFDDLKHVERTMESSNPQFSAQYRVDNNTVVYQSYENGTEFLMNFNDYKVVVYWEGKLYSIDGYGYVVLNRGNE